MDDNEFREFWDWLLDKSNTTEWHDSWLESRKEEWDQMPVCECGHRMTKTETVRSKTENYILERTVKCANCWKIIETIDNRESIIRSILGDTWIKDLEILREEVGLEADHEG